MSVKPNRQILVPGCSMILISVQFDTVKFGLKITEIALPICLCIKTMMQTKQVNVNEPLEKLYVKWYDHLVTFGLLVTALQRSQVAGENCLELFYKLPLMLQDVLYHLKHNHKKSFACGLSPEQSNSFDRTSYLAVIRLAHAVEGTHQTVVVFGQLWNIKPFHRFRGDWFLWRAKKRKTTKYKEILKHL